eukprot:scaffold44179_cov15-Tisochrysis_lutea.AAC.1
MMKHRSVAEMLGRCSCGGAESPYKWRASQQRKSISSKGKRQLSMLRRILCCPVLSYCFVGNNIRGRINKPHFVLRNTKHEVKAEKGNATKQGAGMSSKP